MITGNITLDIIQSVIWLPSCIAILSAPVFFLTDLLVLFNLPYYRIVYSMHDQNWYLIPDAVDLATVLSMFRWKIRIHQSAHLWRAAR